MKNSSPAWPFLSVLACLFVLSITTPRAWEQIARQGTLTKRLAAIHREHSSPPNAAARQAPAPPELPARPVEVVLAPAAIANPMADQNKSSSIAPALASAAGAFDARRFVVGPGYVVLKTAPAFGRQVSNSLIEIASRPAPPAFRPDPPLPAPAPKMADALATASAREQQAIVPAALFDQLNALQQHPSSRAWARAAQNNLRELSSASVDGHAAIFGELESLADDAKRLSADAAEPALQSQLLRTGYAIQRRIPVWRCVVAMENQAAGELQASNRLPDANAQVARSLAELETLTATRSDGKAWREHLELDRIGRAARDPQTSAAARQRLAQRVLDRLASARQISAHRATVDDARIAALAAGLEGWASEPSSPRRLLAEIETFERTGLTSDARMLAVSMKTLTHSPIEADRSLAANLEEHYSNANFRVAVSGGFINRLLPRPQPMQMPIAETLAGTAVRGQGAAWTQLKVVLIPDVQRIRLGLEADGTIRSDTMSEVGPAKFRNASTGSFRIQKLLLMGSSGLRSWPAIASARNSPASLVALETDYDRIPLVNYLVRSVARSKHEEAAQSAIGEADFKLANRVREQFDAEADARVTQSQATFTQRIGESLERLRLEATPISFSTTDDRAVMRYRLAASDQLGAHTPRPRAPSDSLLSVQMHESAMNNLLAGLDLEGHRFTLPELVAKLRDKLGRPELQAPEDISDEVDVTFAAQNAIRVELKDNRLELRLAIAELTHGRSHWRDFTVRAKYALRSDGLEASLQRESGIALEGASMKGKPELVLRGIFGRALSQRRHIPLSYEKIVHDPRLQDLKVTQLVIEDGWLGLAYGPRIAEREARRPKSGVERR